MHNSFDDKLEKFYRPMYVLGMYLDYMLSQYSSDTNIFTKFLYRVGLIIPTSCPFKRKYNLSFTPCKLNPIFPLLSALASWARREEGIVFLFDHTFEASSPGTINETDNRDQPNQFLSN